MGGSAAGCHFQWSVLTRIQRVWVVYACKFLHLANHIRLTCARWGCMDTAQHLKAQYAASSFSTNSDTPCWCSHYDLLSVHTLTRFQAYCSKFRFPNSRTVGGLHNTSLSSLALEAIFTRQRSSQETGPRPFDTDYCTNWWNITFNFKNTDVSSRHWKPQCQHGNF